MAQPRTDVEQANVIVNPQAEAARLGEGVDKPEIDADDDEELDQIADDEKQPDA